MNVWNVLHSFFWHSYLTLWLECTLTPSLPQPVKFQGWKGTYAPANSIFTAPNLLSILYINPFTALSYTFSGFKRAHTRPQTVYLSVLICFQYCILTPSLRAEKCTYAPANSIFAGPNLLSILYINPFTAGWKVHIRAFKPYICRSKSTFSIVY